MVVWGMRKRVFQASEHGCRGGVLGCRGLRNGGYEASLHAQNWVKGEKEQTIFAIIRACKTASYSGKKMKQTHSTPSILPLYRILITNTLQLRFTSLQHQLPHYGRHTMQWTKNLHLHLQLQKKSFCVT